MAATPSSRDAWPSLPYEEVRPTVDHLHRLAQIGGKYTLDLPFEFNWGGWPADLAGPRHDGWYASTHPVFAR